jgi:hypothetical protein
MRLSTKLSLLIMSVLFAGLLIASVLTATLLQSSLIKQVDDDLWNTYSSIALRVLVEGTQSETDQADSDYLLPSDYYMAFRSTTASKIPDWYTPDTNAEHGTPDLSQYIPSDPQRFRSTGTRSGGSWFEKSRTAATRTATDMCISRCR